MISRRLARAIPSWTAAFAIVLAAPLAFGASSGVSVRIDTGSAPYQIVRDGSGERVKVASPGWDITRDPGSPELPFRIVRILLPQGSTTAGTVAATFSGEHALRRGFAPVLATPAVSIDGGTADAPQLFTADALMTSTSYPPVRARLLSTGTLHGYTIATVAVFPFRTEGGILYRAENFEITVPTRPAEAPLATRVRHREGFRESLRTRLTGMVENPSAIDAYSFPQVVVPKGELGFTPSIFPSLEGSAVDYVIVTTDALAASMQTLADWKTSKGVPTVVRTTQWIAANYRNGSDLAETIRTFAADAYAQWGITYLMLAGDVEQVPMRQAFSSYYGGGRNLPVDMYFGCLDGDWNGDHDATFGEFGVDDADLLAEVYVGRLPVQNPAEATIMIEKIKDYERPVFRTYMKKVLLLGEVLFPQGWQPPQIVTLNGADITEFVRLSWMTDPSLSITRLYETSSLFPGSLPETRQRTLDSLNAGYNHVVHIGHGFRFNMSVGDVSIVNADADALVNGDRLANLNMLNCTAAAYAYQCLAEHYLRNPTGGAVSVVGANDSAFPSVAGYYIEEYYRLMLNQNIVHLGEVFARSREERTYLADGADSIDRWTHFVYTLLGDPEMPLFTKTPDILAVTHPGSVNKGTNNITVTVLAGGNPVDSATVCLSKGGDDYEVATTNGAGQATLSFRAESAGTIDVVVTGRNHKRYDGTITVGGTGAYVAINSMTIDDDNAGGTSGNGNGVIEGGETVDLGITLRNNGTATTGTVSIVLRTSDAGVTVVDSTAAVGAVIAAGVTGLATGGVRVSFPSNVSDEHASSFVLIIRNNGVDTWRDDFKKVVHQPALSLVRLRIDDTGTGNGNGLVEAGEQFKLYYKVKNFGTGAYPGGNATVTDLDAAFTLVDPTDPYPAIATLSEAENTGGFVLVESSVATEHRLRLSIIDSYGRAYVDTLELRVPVPPTALVVDPSLGPDRLQVTWTASVSPDVARYNLYRSLNVGGPFTLVNSDPVAHGYFVTTGLTPTTKYFFRATTVDVSGNESATSVVFSGSTNPAQMPGFPIDMQSETTSSPAIGDVDGDGVPEIVVGDKYVYAWHANGQELLDGDNDGLTWGPINKTGDTFVSHVALARMDGEPGLEIIAASRLTKQVFVFDKTGQSIPGWPRPVENFIRAGMVVADLDLDNLFEVVAIDELGVLYVWNHDGTEYMDGDANPGTQGVFKRLTGATFQYSTPAIANIAGSSREEIVVGTQNNELLAFHDNGTAVTGFPVALTDDISGSPAIGDVDGNGDLEIVINTRNGTVRALNHDGTTLWTRFTTNGITFGPSPALADVDADGKLETFLPASNGKLYCFTYTGADRAGFPVNYSATTYTESSPIIADINGDGLRDVIIGSEEKYIWGFDRNGVVLDGFPLTTDDAMRGVPALGDVDLDGDVDLVAAGWDKNVYVWDFMGAWNAANAPWPRFHANLHNNGRIGFVVPTPVESASFAYTVVDGGFELVWQVPLSAGSQFAVERAEVVNGEAGDYRRVGTGIGIGMDGSVRVVDRGLVQGSRYAYRLLNDDGTVHESMGLYIPVTRAALGQNFPNPFNPVTKIEYWVPEAKAGSKTAVSVEIYDVRGARVRSLVRADQAAGRYLVEWDGRDDRGNPSSSGVYFYRMVTPTFSGVHKMMLLK